MSQSESETATPAAKQSGYRRIWRDYEGLLAKRFKAHATAELAQTDDEMDQASAEVLRVGTEMLVAAEICATPAPPGYPESAAANEFVRDLHVPRIG